MSQEEIIIGEVEERYTSTGKQSGYQVEMNHIGLEETRHLSARDLCILEGKIKNQESSWRRKWESALLNIERENKEDDAKKLTEESKKSLSDIENILSHTLEINDEVDWNSIKNFEPLNCKEPEKKVLIETPKKPNLESYISKVPLLTLIFGGKQKYLERQKKLYEKDLHNWKYKKNEISKENEGIEDENKKNLLNWQLKKDTYENNQEKFNSSIDDLKKLYLKKNPDAIKEYCEIVLNNSQYPESFPKDFEIQFNDKNGILIIDFYLPSIDDIPNRASVRYVKARDELEEKFLSKSAHSKLFESAIYQIALRTIHEIFEADTIESISSVNFNGLVSATDPATGHKETKCIVSIQSNKEEFLKINLEKIDPKSCFKSLKGVGSAKLSTITPIQPILQLDRSDNRFKDHYNIANDIEESTNLASMDWEDFEHLIREIFEKEFASNGGEVKVTQASSDGGVDAIAFDPDPIRGGKIVIQAKRYTNTVGVSAVRDLYGTVMNEGAMKGVLVTTADYGPDSYNFAKGKPLTLLNGSNLLHLLGSHGNKARIDIKEAKKIAKENK